MPGEKSEGDETKLVVQLTKGTAVGHYRIIEKIGAGGMGEVYLAEDTSLNRMVALKFLSSHLCHDADCRARFKREAQAAAKLSHPNITTIHEVGEFQRRPFFAMEHVKGQSLCELIKMRELPIERLIDLAIQISEGLHNAHQSGIIHRDIKPANILIDAEGRPKIADFGLASVQGCDHLTRAGSTLGTIGYMSPEQAKGEETDYRSDIFSFAVVLYEMVSGKLPFKGENDAATLHNIVYQDPEPLSRYKANVPADLQRIVCKALAKREDERYQHVDDLLADLRHLRSTLEPISAPHVTPKRKRRRIWMPVSALVIVALLVLILKPWKLEFAPTQEAAAAADQLAVMYFDNVTDPSDNKRLGEIATNLLITGLSQSQCVKVVSSQRLYDLLKQTGKEGMGVIDRATASEIAKKAEAKWMLTGSILQFEPKLVLTTQLIEVGNGSIIASQRIAGNPGEDIFMVIDRLTEEVRRSNAFPTGLQTESSFKVADVTTHSPDAYRYYLEGLEYRDKFYYEDAQRSLKKAIEYDSSFAAAYIWLAYVMPAGKDQDDVIAKAERYADRASDLDRRVIQLGMVVAKGDRRKSIDAYREFLKQYPDSKLGMFGLANEYGQGKTQESLDSAVRCCSQVLALDPTFKLAYNTMAYAYSEMGRHREAIEAINKYIELAPDEANPYDSRGDMYAAQAMADSAIDSYRRALAIKPDFSNTPWKLAHLYLLEGKYTKADSSFQAYVAALPKPDRGAMRVYLSAVPVYQYRMRRVLSIMDDCISANKLENMEEENGSPFYVKGIVYDILGMPDSAASMARLNEKANEKRSLEDRFGLLEEIISWYYNAGDTVAALHILRQLQTLADSGKPARVSTYWRAKGKIALVRRDFPQAIEYLTRADSAKTEGITRLELAKAYLGSGDARRSIPVLERLVTDYTELWNMPPMALPEEYYLLGQAYEAIGERDKARSVLEKLMTIWKDADPGIKAVEDARARLARLRRGA